MLKNLCTPFDACHMPGPLMVLHLTILTIFFEGQNVQNHTYEIFPQRPAKFLPILPILSALFANTPDLLSLPTSHLLNHGTFLHQNISKMVIEWFSTWCATCTALIYRLAVRQTFWLIVFFYQLDAQILYFTTFITFLYMFQALLCSSSGGQLY